MLEYPKNYPNSEAFIAASQPIMCNDIIDFFDGVSDHQVDSIMCLFTPKDTLEQTTHEIEVINTQTYSTFDELRERRELIRTLRLVPRRSKPAQQEYENMRKETFINIVRNHYIYRSPLILVHELYPFDLPSEIGQNVLWMVDDATPDFLVAQFLGAVMTMKGLTTDDVILFERSRKSNTNYAKVSVPEIRHIHMWTRIKI